MDFSGGDYEGESSSGMVDLILAEGFYERKNVTTAYFAQRKLRALNIIALEDQTLWCLRVTSN